MLFYYRWFKSGSKSLGIYPFVSKLIFAKSPQTIEKSEQFRCHLNHSLLLDFTFIIDASDFSDIPTSLEWYFWKAKVILKPSVSVILYLPLNCAKHNITRRKPNITAQQYNLPQANITEKTTCRNKSFFLAPPVGLEPTTTRLTAACSTDWAKEEYLSPSGFLA